MNIIIPYEVLDDIYDVVTKEDIVVDYIYQCEEIESIVSYQIFRPKYFFKHSG